MESAGQKKRGLWRGTLRRTVAAEIVRLWNPVMTWGDNDYLLFKLLKRC